ncbi:MAG TPA: hypothetical protein VIK72_04490 [Clostridiaceae bacterium]
MRKQKKIGFGSLSIVLFFVGVLFALSFDGVNCIDDKIFKLFNLETWSNNGIGFHYSLVISILIFLLSQFIGKKNKKDLGAIMGRNLSFFFGPFMVIMVVIMGLINR